MTSQTVEVLFLNWHLVACKESNNWMMNHCLVYSSLVLSNDLADG